LVLIAFAIPSLIDPSGLGVLGNPKGSPEMPPEEGEDASMGWSVIAVVAAALAMGVPVVEGGGSREAEKPVAREVVDSLEARDPGLSGEEVLGK
jgi:hypothetical protein